MVYLLEYFIKRERSTGIPYYSFWFREIIVVSREKEVKWYLGAKNGDSEGIYIEQEEMYGNHKFHFIEMAPGDSKVKVRKLGGISILDCRNKRFYDNLHGTGCNDQTKFEDRNPKKFFKKEIFDSNKHTLLRNRK